MGRYEEASSSWGRIKTLYMEIQHDKCAYCERQLASADHGGTIEHDVEHYRPKNGVKKWPSEAITRERGLSYRFSTGDELPEGYFLLAYHLFNYATACKKCNSPLKANYFPIAGDRRAQSDDPDSLRGEKPFLLYPIGDLDEDPEEILTFIGINPVPRVKSGPRQRRARVTIDFFELDGREELWRERAEKILSVFIALELMRTGEDENRDLARDTVEVLLASSRPHSNCGRSFRALYLEDRSLARRIAESAREYLASQS